MCKKSLFLYLNNIFRRYKKVNLDKNIKSQYNTLHKHKKYIIGSFLLLFFISTCRTLDKQRFHKALFSESESLNLKGDNSIAHWGKEGLWLLSGHRTHHHMKQLYFYNISLKTLKRVTHQDGAILSFYKTPRWIYYSSTTDELKEYPDLSEFIDEPLYKKSPHLHTFPSTEIYRSQPDGFNIERLTHHVGYDGNPQVYKDIKLFYSSIDKNRSQIYELNLNRKRKKKILVQYPRAFQIHFQFSHDFKKLVWKHWNSKSNQFEWVLGDRWGKIEHVILKNVHSIAGITWNKTNDAILFSSNHIEGQHNVFFFGLKEKCLMQVSEHELTNPVLNPDDTKIAFLSHKSNNKDVSISNIKTFPSCP